MLRSQDILTTRRAVTVALALAAMCGCATDALTSDRTEQQVLDDLARYEVPLPYALSAIATSEPPSAPSTLPAEGPITLADLWSVAQRSNPRLGVARSEIGRAAGAALQASLYPNPTVELSTEEQRFHASGPLSKGATVISISQPIVLGRRLAAAEQAAKADQAISAARLSIVEREVFGEIASHCSRLLSNREAGVLYEELLGLHAETLNIAQARFDARVAPETEVLKSQVECQRIQLLLARLQREQRAVARQLALLVGVKTIDVDRIAGQLPEGHEALDLAQLESLLVQEHPALHAANLEIAAAQARLDKVRAERVPDLELHAGAGYGGEAESGIYELGVGVTLPLWDDRRGDLLAARYALMQARQQRQAWETELRAQLAHAHADHETSREQLISILRDVLPNLTRAHELTTESYRAGNTTFLDTLDSQRALAEARATVVDLRAEVARARARIIKIIGDAVWTNVTTRRLASDSNTSLPIKVPLSGAEDSP